jgi:nitroimidazol reductase NimA-like FMN-containing flavoprotein (pyridoxamine 5'-phosphate oxidase superfamily)
MPETRDLTRDECRELLGAGSVGRVAVATPAGPHIVPVNYAVVDGALVVRTTPYSLLGTYGRDTTLAFEIDCADTQHECGWSVVARGRSEVLHDPDDVDEARAAVPRPWAGGQRSLFLRIPMEELSGRRLGDQPRPGSDTSTSSARAG